MHGGGRKRFFRLAIYALALLWTANASPNEQSRRSRTKPFTVTPMTATYARPDQQITLWGNLNTSEAESEDSFYEWSFEHGPEVEMIELDALNGEVEQPHNIAVDVIFNLTNATKSNIKAIITVTNGSEEARAETVITVISNADPESDTTFEAIDIDRKIAARKALRFLYLRQRGDGGWRGDYEIYGNDDVAATAASLWAFQNFGHTPDKESSSDPYQNVVQRGLDYLLAHSEYVSIASVSGRNPDLNGDGRALSLGSRAYTWAEGYARGMALAALCATGTPERRTYLVPFANDGAGTSYRQIAHDAAEYILWGLAGNMLGGWHYSFSECWWADSSIASWNYLGLEAALTFGFQLPEWAQERPEMLLARTYNEDGSFGYDGHFAASPACSGSGLTGLFYITLNGRQSGLDHGRMSVRSLKHMTEMRRNPRLWNDPYQMWTVARGLRLADVKCLIHNQQPYDWQRNISAPGATNEGFWPFLCRTQSADGSWPGNYMEGSAEVIFNTAFYALCLSTGVVGAETALEKIKVQSRIEKQESLELLTVNSEIPPQVQENDEDAEIVLEWSLQRLAAGEVADLSYNQYLHDLVEGQSRQVQKSVSVSYQTAQGEQAEQNLGELTVDVAKNLYSADVQVEPKTAAAGQTVTVHSFLQLPQGQKWQMIKEPSPGPNLLSANSKGRGAEWTSLEFDLLNEEEFGAESLPVIIQLRSASTQSALSRALFSDSVSEPGLLHCTPGNLVELNLQLQANSLGILPQVRNLTLFYNSATARAVLEITDDEGTVVALLRKIDFGKEDYGSTRSFVTQWTVPDNVHGELQARLSVFEDNRLVLQAVDDFQITADFISEIKNSVNIRRRYYSCNEDVQIRSVLENKGDRKEALTVFIDICDNKNRSVLQHPFQYDLTALDPGARDVRSIIWNTALHKPGEYSVRQRVFSHEIEQLDEVKLEVEPAFVYSDGLAGEVNADPAIVEFPGSFDVQWLLQNCGNASWENADVKVRIVSLSDPLHDVRFERLLQTGDLLQAEALQGRWEDAESEAKLPLGDYLLLLQVKSAEKRTEAQTIAVGNLQFVDTTPPVTTHNYAHEDEWTASNVSLQFSAQDAGSGVSATSFTINDTTTVETMVNIAEEGVTEVYYRSEDNAGNLEPDQLLIVKIDQTPPVLEHDYATGTAWHSAPIAINANATDSYSGIAEFHALLNDVPMLNAPGMFEISDDGVHLLKIAATDVVGNDIEEQLEICIDKTPPVITHTFTAGSQWQHEPVYIQFAIEDNLSGLLSARYFIDNEEVSADDGNVLIDVNGEHTVRVEATDLAGNSSNIEVQVLLSLTGPSITHNFNHDGEWINRDAVIQFQAVSQYHPIERLWYVLDDNSAVEENEVVVSEGVHKLVLAAIDTAQTETSLELSVKVDQAPPITGINPGIQSNSWLTKPFTLDLQATDNENGSGLNQTFYILNDSQPQTGSEIELTTDGIHSISYWSTDVAGNQEEEKQVEVKIDTVAPRITHDCTHSEQWLNQAVQVNFSAEDDLSGIQETAWSLDGGAQNKATQQVEITTSGKHNLTLEATDEAGNSASEEVRIWIDRQPPVLQHDFDDEGKTKKEISIEFSATDEHSGIAATWYNLDGKARVKADKVTVSKQGEHSLLLGATDNAGNEKTETITFKISNRVRSVGNLSDLRAAASQLVSAKSAAAFEQPPDAYANSAFATRPEDVPVLASTHIPNINSETPKSEEKRQVLKNQPAQPTPRTSISDKIVRNKIRQRPQQVSPLQIARPSPSPVKPSTLSLYETAERPSSSAKPGYASNDGLDPVFSASPAPEQHEDSFVSNLRRWAIPAVSALLLVGLVGVSSQASTLILVDQKADAQIFHEPGRETLLWQLHQFVEHAGGLRKFYLEANAAGNCVWLQRGHEAEVLLVIQPSHLVLRYSSEQGFSEIDVTNMLEKALQHQGEIHFCVGGPGFNSQIPAYLQKIFPKQQVATSRRKFVTSWLNRKKIKQTAR